MFPKHQYKHFGIKHFFDILTKQKVNTEFKYTTKNDPLF